MMGPLSERRNGRDVLSRRPVPLELYGGLGLRRENTS